MNKFFLTILSLPVLSFGLPDLTTTQIEAGEVAFESLANELKITASDGAIIQYWSGMDISAGETIRFIQPNSQSTVINQIFSTSTPTQINGNLFANGKVVLLNSAGILFGKGAVVEVGKLHAIAGSVAFQGDYELLDKVENKGLIKAGEVLFAGSSISNSGTILVENGVAVFAAGSSGTFTLLSEDGDVSVNLSIETSKESMMHGVSDIAGQAVMQSGVVQASKALFYGDKITNSGSINAESVSIANFNSLSSGEGVFSASTLNLIGGIESNNASSVDLGFKSNKIQNIDAKHFFDSLKIFSSSSSLSFGKTLTEDSKLSKLSVQNLDLRVYEGDLILNLLPIQLDLYSDNSLLLAAEKNLFVGYSSDQFSHSRKIFYGQNFYLTNTSKLELQFDSIKTLDASMVTIDDISASLSPQIIETLTKSNTSFYQDGLEMTALESMDINNLFKNQLFPEYSYFLNSVPPQILVDEVENSASVDLSNEIGSSGGTSVLFGGSFSIINSSGSTLGGGEPGSNQTGGDSGAEDAENDSSEDNGNQTRRKKPNFHKRFRALGAIPFSPISKSISSIEASIILESALTSEIELKLNQYLD